MATVSPSVRDLRRLWKPHKERLTGQQEGHPTPIRFHRACSWLAELEAPELARRHDLVLVYQWIAFNALYGQWDDVAREPRSDCACWKQFVERLLKLDTAQRLQGILVAEQPLILAIVEDPYLNRYYWQNPGEQSAQRARGKRHRIIRDYFDRLWLDVLLAPLERVYLLRCQLVHGAASNGGKLNRAPLERCTRLMAQLLPAMLQVWIEHGADEDWGTMCYPPMTDARTEKRADLSPRPR